MNKTTRTLLVAAALAITACTRQHTSPDETQGNTLKGKDIRDIVREEVRAALPTPSATAKPTPEPTIDPLALRLSNPYLSQAEREEIIRKHGVTMTGVDGSVWARIRRNDNDDISKGLTPQTTVIEGDDKTQPVCEKQPDGGWKVTWQLAKPAATATPTATP